MKTAALLLFFFLLSASFAKAQHEHTVAIDSTVQKIKQQLPAFTKIEKLNSDTAYKFMYADEDGIRLITVKGIYNGIEKNVAWYYEDGQLIYSEQKWYDLQTERLINYQRFYLVNGRLVAWIDSSKRYVPSSSAMYKDLDATLGPYAQELRDRP